MNASAPPWDFLVIILALATLVPWRANVRVRKLLAQAEFSARERIALYATTIAFQWFAAAVVVWRALARGLSPAQLGLATDSPFRAYAVGVALSAFFAANQIYALKRFAREGARRPSRLVELTRRLIPASQIEVLAFLALAVTAGVCEEILYRGFVYAVIDTAFLGAWPLAILGSAALFSIAHSYQGKRGVLATFFAGILFGLARFWTGSLVPCVLAHAVADIAAGLAARKYLPRLGAPGAEVVSGTREPTTNGSTGSASPNGKSTD